MNDALVTPRWLVVLGAGGEIIATERGAPAALRGSRIDEEHRVPPALRQAAEEALRAWRRAPAEITRASASIADLGVDVDLVVLPAVGIRRARTDPRALLAYAMGALERQARALDVTLSLDTATSVPDSLWLDPEKTAWAVTSIAGNALRHVKRGTRQRPGGTITITAEVTAGELVVRVADDGPGMPADVLERLFQRAPGAPHATGLALTVVRDVVNAHGGALAIDSSTAPESHGTVVTIRWPVG